MGNPTNACIIYSSETPDGKWCANLDATDMKPEFQPTKKHQGHAMILSDAIVDLLDKWKADILEQRENNDAASSNNQS